MISTFPAVCDALAQRWSVALGSDLVFDGPAVRQAGPNGLSIGATREDISSSFTADPADLGGGYREETTISCLAWAGGGGTVFKPFRDAVRQIVQTALDSLAADPTLGGVVSTAELIGGTWSQDQSGDGGLVTCEFQVVVRKF
jgi:hypothetical protein